MPSTVMEDGIYPSGSEEIVHVGKRQLEEPSQCSEEDIVKKNAFWRDLLRSRRIINVVAPMVDQR